MKKQTSKPVLAWARIFDNRIDVVYFGLTRYEVMCKQLFWSNENQRIARVRITEVRRKK